MMAECVTLVLLVLVVKTRTTAAASDRRSETTSSAASSMIHQQHFTSHEDQQHFTRMNQSLGVHCVMRLRRCCDVALPSTIPCESEYAPYDMRTVYKRTNFLMGKEMKLQQAH